MPKVSIVIPCYNQGQYLDEAVNSVLNQTYQDFEIIIVNDGSRDDTELVALNLSKKDTRILYYYKNNGGLSSARNFGYEKSNGDYIQFLVSDYTIYPDKLKKQIDIFENDKTIDICYTNYILFDVENGKVLDKTLMHIIHNIFLIDIQRFYND